MPTLVIKSLPKNLHSRLKRSAQSHRRSVTQETIVQLEAALAQQERAPRARRGDLSYWGDRELLPSCREALEAGAFSTGTDSSRMVAEDRDAR